MRERIDDKTTLTYCTVKGGGSIMFQDKIKMHAEKKLICKRLINYNLRLQLSSLQQSFVIGRIAIRYYTIPSDRMNICGKYPQGPLLFTAFFCSKLLLSRRDLYAPFPPCARYVGGKKNSGV